MTELDTTTLGGGGAGGLLTYSTQVGLKHDHKINSSSWHRLPLPDHLMAARSSDDVNSPRKLTRQTRLRNPGLLFSSLPENSRSSPASPECCKSRSPNNPTSRGKSCSSSSSSFVGGSPQPLPLPQAAASKDAYCSRKSTDQLGATSSSSSSSSKKCRQNATNPGGGAGFGFKLGLNVQSRTRTKSESTTQFSPQQGHHLVSPHRAKTMDCLPSQSIHAAVNNYNRGMGFGMSQEANLERDSYNLSKSAPTSVLSSPAVSPRRSSVHDPFPFYMPRQQDSGATLPSLLLSPKNTTPTLSPNHSPLHSPRPRSPHLSPKASHNENNSLATSHPLPLPPRATVAPQPQSIVMHQNGAPNVAVPSMKGQWQKGKLIGRGTFGTVYLATNRETGALCAMKEVDLIPDDPKCAESIKQLEQEIKVLRTLKHPNIVQYYGSEAIGDHFYIYLEYVYPGSINKYVQDHFGAMTESVVRNFTRHILCGLAYLHDTKTIHRDIKGANLLVDSSGVVKLADFGMAKHLSAYSYTLSLKGSPYWMAPEVIKAVIQNDGDPNLALAVDIWSLGCTIIEMFNGKPPWSEFEGPQAMFKVLHRTPDIPEKLSAEGKEFLSLCFKRNPAERPSAKKLLDHPFVRISNDQNGLSYPRAISLVNLMEKLNSPTDHMKKIGRVLVGPRSSN